jgi:hypothetical protein
MGTQLYLPAGWARQLESRLDPIERLEELEKDRTQAKGDIREILDRLTDRKSSAQQTIRSGSSMPTTTRTGFSNNFSALWTTLPSYFGFSSSRWAITSGI